MFSQQISLYGHTNKQIKKNTTFKIHNVFVFMLKLINIFHSVFFFLACSKAVEYSLVGIFNIFVSVDPGDPFKFLRGIV